jgi:DNA-binding beta-propeller fold protein YncE
MVLGRAGRPSVRLVGVCIAFVCLMAWDAGAALAANGDYVKSFGPDGSASTEFSGPAALGIDQETGAVYVADRETQTLYKFDAEGTPLDYGGTSGYISGNEITGLNLRSGSGEAEVAVDPETHVVYVTSNNRVRAFEADGEPHNFTEGSDAGTNELSGASELVGVAVDSSGKIYTTDRADRKVRIYSQSGTLVTEFVSENEGHTVFRPLGPIALAPDGTVYVTSLDAPPVVYAFEPSEFPVTSESTYGLGRPLDGAVSVPVAVDPETGYVYVGQVCQPADGCAYRIRVYDENEDFVGVIGAEGAGTFEGLPIGLGANGQSKKLYALVRGDGPTAL